MKSLPSVSVIIPCLNEEHFIEGCITSLLNGSFPSEKMEILVVDGGSDDHTKQRVVTLINDYPQIKLLFNSKKIVPAAMNIGLEKAENDVIVWCGAHATYGRNYIVNSVTVLLETGCASVGGVITPIARTQMGKNIALATSSKFGIGNAHYRYSTIRRSVDTVFGGCFLKKNVTKIGGFNENWIRNQDYEFNYRLRTEIGQVILDPSIKCDYFCRESLTSLAKQYFQYGFWRFKTLLRHPNSLSSRQVAPVALILGLLGSTILLVLGYKVGYLLPMIYVGSALMVSSYIAINQRKIKMLAFLPQIFCTIHLTWGAGFIISMCKTLYIYVQEQISPTLK